MKRIDRVAPAALVPAVPPAIAPAPPDDSAELAREMGQSFGETVKFYRDHFGATLEEAMQKAGEAADVYLDRTLNGPPDQVSWGSLDYVAQRDPERARQRWEEVKGAARREVRTGHRAARAVDATEARCWERARYLAARAELAEGLRPRSGVEELLLDQLAQWQILLWRWQEIVAMYTSFANDRSYRAAKKPSEYELTRLSEAESLERALAMVERLHRLYMRTLKALQDQRRSPGVVVRNAGQVNVANQQVNVSR